MNTHPIISIIICAHNEEQYIAECIESILRYRNGYSLQIIVVENGCTDATVNIIRNYPVKLVREDRMLGLPLARLQGLKYATGDLIAFLDADNRVSPHWFQIIESAFARNPALVCLSGPYRYNEFGFVKYWLHFLLNFLFSWSMYLLLGRMIRGGNFVLHKRCIADFERVATMTNFLGEDVLLSNLLAKHGKCKYSESFWVYSSIRRFDRTGYWRTLFQYLLIFIKANMRMYTSQTTHSKYSRQLLDIHRTSPKRI